MAVASLGSSIYWPLTTFRPGGLRAFLHSYLGILHHPSLCPLTLNMPFANILFIKLLPLSGPCVSCWDSDADETEYHL